MALPGGRRGQALAAALTAVTLLAVWFAAVAPAWDWYQDRAELLRRQQAMARRMAALVETLPDLQREAARVDSAGAAGPGAAATLLTGDTDPIAAAALQQRIDELAAGANVRVASEEILPGQTDGGLRAVSVRLGVAAPYRGLVAFLLALARSDIPMIADEMLMRAARADAESGDTPIEATLTVTSFRGVKAAAR